MRAMKTIKTILIILLANLACYAQFNTTDIEPFQITSNQTTLGESSVFIDRNNPNNVVIANNAFDFNNGNNLNVTVSTNKGLNWNGSFFFQNDAFADPYCAIDKNGRIYVSYLKSGSPAGILLRFSDDNGISWSPPILIASTTLIDKPILYINNSRANNTSTIYCAYREYSNFHIYITKASLNNLNSWSTPVELWNASVGGSKHQSPNISIGPEGNVYVAWAIYDVFTNVYRDESAIGFARSVDGGNTWNCYRVDYNTNLDPNDPPTYIPLGIKGINTTDGLFEAKAGVRHASFPTMAVNQQNGNIYIAWANRGLAPNAIDPNSKDINFIKSNDNGIHWSSPIKLFVDPIAELDQWQPYMACDPFNGMLSVVYYNSVAFVNNDAFDTYNSVSMDDGQTWQHYKISDNPTTTLQLTNYIAHDYNGNDLCNGLGMPTWCDGRNGLQTVYAQPFEIPCVTDLSLCNPVTPFYKIEKAQNNIVVSDNCNYEMLNGSDIRMLAGNSIQMKSGFHAANGSVLHTKINAACVPENVQRANNNLIIENPVTIEKRKTTLAVNPNPVNEEINITISNTNGEKVTLVIYDNNGRQVITLLENFGIKNLSTLHFYFPIANLKLTSGSYFLNAQLSNESLTTLLIIK